jgi:arabinofuranosyltransferase
LLALALACFTVLFWCHSWLGDDIFITLRVADNWRHGLGLVWNVGERVQVYTHPLWLFCILLAQQAIPNLYLCVLALSWLCGALLIALLVLRAKGLRLAAASLLILFSSRIFIDYSASGLENPLSHLLILLFAMQLYAQRGRGCDGRQALGLYLLACLLMLDRQDLLLLALPGSALVFSRHARQAGWAKALGLLGLGFLPWLAWEAFSLLYYGFPFPNTAYAKLGTGLPHSAFWHQGLVYFKDSLSGDWVLLPATALGLAWAAWAGGAEGAALALGGLFYLAFVLWVGGDFMLGRFFTAPLMLGVASLALLPCKPRWALAAALALALAGAVEGHAPFCFQLDTVSDIPRDGVADEKAYYHPTSSLLYWHGRQPWPLGMFAKTGLDLHQASLKAPLVYATGSIGMVGYYAGPRAFIIDQFALSDPLLARLPANTGIRIGHFTRHLPEGYKESLVSGRPCFADPGLAAYYNHLCLLTRAPLFMPGRLREILRFNLGAYEPLKAHYISTLKQ